MRLGLLLLGALAAAAQEGAPKLLPMEEAARLALSENSDLVALRMQEEALRLRARQALSPASPTVSYSRNNMSSAALGPAASRTYGAAFTVGFPGKALSQSAASRLQARSTQELGIAKAVEILSALSSNYAALTANDKLRALLEEEKKKADDIVKLLEQKYSLAQASQVDLLNARVTAARFSHEILVARGDRDLLVNQFLNLIKRPGSKDLLPKVPEEIGIPALDLGPDQLTALMLRNRHLLRAASFQVDASREALTQARLAPFPDFQLSASRNDYSLVPAQPNPDRSRDYSVGLALVFPLFFPFNELRGIQAARRDLDAAASQLEAQRLAAISDLLAVYNDFVRTLREKESLARLVLPAAKETYDLLLRNYTFGKTDYLKLNEARSTWVQAQQDLLQKQLDAVRDFSQLTQQLGCDLVRKDGPYACQ